MFEWIASPEAWVALATLMALEIVLGIDNIIFISILVGRLPEKQRAKARKIGLSLAMGTRLLLLFSLAWVMGLVEPLFIAFGNEISGRDIILVIGGLFLLAKSTHEIHGSFEIQEASKAQLVASGFISILIQIAILDVVFSLDSVITAVGLVDHLSIMVIAIVASVGVMLVAAKPIGDFVDANPTIKMLALSFLMLIGFTLIAEGFDVHIPKGYVYFAMAFSFVVEMLNIKIRNRRAKAVETIQLAKKITEDENA
ncbi:MULTISPECIES: TerC family protein [unclassified Marinobacter]|jgi:predicted tellurium resistance membrane protein TerC|uniref:TerC family protein n=1 Tax=unclassified Marinobacter TaxID=83889 RepID=UPI00200D6178|nr:MULTISPECIES: TerC family protein [unclassified Marinobacter]UQG55129.1 TerC family protein [Marinobacter sp. M4C]UQG63931.1 TerC family protein [Marinobacter sp. M2C]UQG68214.1 TerC family protein [Marinobacter sp. M1C]